MNGKIFKVGGRYRVRKGFSDKYAHSEFVTGEVLKFELASYGAYDDVWCFRFRSREQQEKWWCVRHDEPDLVWKNYFRRVWLF